MTGEETLDDVSVAAGEVDRVFAERQLEQMRAGVPLALLSHILTGSCVMAVMLPRADDRVVLGWFAALMLSLAVRWLHLRGFDGALADRRALRRTITAASVLTIATSLIWAAFIPYCALNLTGYALIVVALAAMAVMLGVMLYVPPRAVVWAHLTLMSAGFMAGGALMAGRDSLVVAVMWVVTPAAVVLAHRSSERRIRDGIHAELAWADTAATLNILLNDYQEQGSDWLWRVDAAGRLQHVSDRFAEVTERPAPLLEGGPLLELLLPGDDRAQLAHHLRHHTAFRDLTVRARVGGDLRHWKMSGRPRGDRLFSGVARDVTEAVRAQERVAYIAHTDDLTGLANRHRFNAELAQAMAQPPEAGPPALLYLDLDNFNIVNDTGGHILGDKLLAEVAARLLASRADGDLVARLGGDEFAVLVPAADSLRALLDRAEALLAAIRQPFLLDGELFAISTSIGIAVADENLADPVELTRRADLALFIAKGKGRDRIAVFDAALDAAARDRRTLMEDLREAVARGEFVLQYQPFIDLHTGATRGYEALLRWQHPVRGLLTPADFLDAAEDSGLIVPIGAWALRQAMRETAHWPDGLRIAVNLSPTQLMAPGFTALVRQALSETGFMPRNLELEITEHVWLRDGETAYAALLELRAMGASVALDDFGIGYSSLSYLRRFPFDRIKIDRHFVAGIETSEENRAIVAAITRLAAALGMRTTAEGVENRAQLELLRELGCEEAQGYLVAAAQPVELLGDGKGSADGRAGASIIDYRRARAAASRRRRGDHAA